MKTRSAQLALSTAMSLFLVIGLVENVGARDERGGGGFSRSGPAANGGLSSQATGTAARQAGATQRSGQRAETQQTAARQAGATERSGQRADTRTSGQQERTEREGQRQEGSTERTDTRQQGYSERTQTRASAAENISGNWDTPYHHNNEGGYVLAGAAVGAMAGYIAGAATATPAPATASPTHVVALPCTPSVVTVNGANFYRCDGTWYSRSYVNGNVSYIVVTPPPGH